MADGHAMYSSVINTLLPDNNHLTDTNSDLAKDLSSTRTINDEITALAMKNLKLSWAGDFESLKRVVSDYIKFDGRWTSPGGEKKVCSNPDTSITWWKNKKFLLVEGNQAERIIELFIVILTNIASFRPSDRPGNINIDLPNSDKINLVSSCSCKCNNLTVDIEGIKLDNVVLESRMEHKTNTNTEIINNVQQELLKLQSKCDMLADRVGNIESSNDERDSDTIVSLERQNKFLVEEVKTLNFKLENLEKKAKAENAKAENAINIHANISSPKTTHVNNEMHVMSISNLIPSPKTTHVNNEMHVMSISNLIVDDSEEISIVSSVNDPYHTNVGHNTCNGNQPSGSLPKEPCYPHESNQQQSIPVRITSIRKSKQTRKKVNLRQTELNRSNTVYRVESCVSTQGSKQSRSSDKNKSHNNHRKTNNEGFCTGLSMRDKIGWFNFYY
ncbi:Hypothetical predicted protein [Paramuricea clavata]|uniref:Uncharacterized protein n=1 Tax=Paramuricea clavata TaxID=317549 RepID=A0A6S7LQ89_PARCT|nr:Hypothetical predicted protein [Paramuricea clavata]